MPLVGFFGLEQVRLILKVRFDGLENGAFGLERESV